MFFDILWAKQEVLDLVGEWDAAGGLLEGLIVADNALRRPVSFGVSKRGGVAEGNRLAAAHRGLDSLIVPVPGKEVDGMLVCLKS